MRIAFFVVLLMLVIRPCIVRGGAPYQEGITPGTTPLVGPLVYPNPFRDRLVVWSTDRRGVTIYNIRGRIVFTATTHRGANEYRLDVPSGVYFVRVGDRCVKVVKVE